MPVDSYNVADAVTPDNLQDIPLTDALWIGAAGNLNVMFQGGAQRAFLGLAAGTLMPLKVKRVLLAGTTAGNILALYQQ